MTPSQVLSCKFLEFFNNIVFEGHLWTTASTINLRVVADWSYAIRNIKLDSKAIKITKYPKGETHSELSQISKDKAFRENR